MLLTCKRVYGPTILNGTFSPTAQYTGHAYDTDTRQMVASNGTWNGAFLENKPADIWLQTGDIVWWYCNLSDPADPTSYTDHTAEMVRYVRPSTANGLGSVTFAQEQDSTYCGYEPPDTRTCEILISDVLVAADTATIQTTNAVGPLEYSLDGGITRQSSPLFEELSAGTYTARVYDQGATLPGCQSSRQFTILDFEPGTTPATVAALPEFVFSGNPVVLILTSPGPLRDVIVEIYVEDAHRSGRFQLAYDAKRRTDGAGQARLDVADILAGQLQAEYQFNYGWNTLVKPIRNWFVRVAEVSRTSGATGQWSTSNNSVVLLGGLPPDVLLDQKNYFTSALVKQPFMSWQPSDKKVGPRHLEIIQLLLNQNAPRDVIVQPYSLAGVPSLPERLVYPFPAPAPPAANAVIPPPLTPAQLVRLVQLSIDVSEYPGSLLELTTTDDVTTTGLLRLEIENNSYQPPRQLIFQNSLAGFDTVAMFGNLSDKLTLERGLVEAYQPLAESGASASYETSWPPMAPVHTYQLSTGWTSSYWLEYLQELVTPGRTTYEYYNYKLRPINITTKELQPYEDGQGHAAAVIDYRPAFKNNFYADYERNTNRGSATGAAWRN